VILVTFRNQNKGRAVTARSDPWTSLLRGRCADVAWLRSWASLAYDT
jgi:hypothetical protein